jgi:hypothetical protein
MLRTANNDEQKRIACSPPPVWATAHAIRKCSGAPPALAQDDVEGVAEL